MPFEIVRNDITKMRVDAIVNAANRSLLGGGGVDGAIHHAAGPELLEECRKLHGCETGEAKITGGYRLPARYVIHTVGPIWQDGKHGERELLASCYRNSLRLAMEHDCESIAFPLISSGAYGYPGDQAMAVAVEVISQFLLENEMMVYLVVFGHGAFLISQKLFRDVQEYIDDAYAERSLGSRLEQIRRRMSRREQAERPESLPLESRPEESLPKESLPYNGFVSEYCNGQAAQQIEHDAPCMMAPTPSAHQPDWDQILKKADEGFSQTLLRLIDERGMTDAQCYKKANIDRKLFSKIRSNPAYKPSKPTVFAFAVSLELSLRETQKLLNRAGYALSHSSQFDLIMEYFISHRQYNIYEINEVLFQFDMPLLGSGTM